MKEPLKSGARVRSAQSAVPKQRKIKQKLIKRKMYKTSNKAKKLSQQACEQPHRTMEPREAGACGSHKVK